VEGGSQKEEVRRRKAEVISGKGEVRKGIVEGGNGEAGRFKSHENWHGKPNPEPAGRRVGFLRALVLIQIRHSIPATTGRRYASS